MSNWVPISIRQPPAEGNYLTYAPIGVDGKVPYICICWWHPAARNDTFLDGYKIDHPQFYSGRSLWAKYITHWRPLPNPPK